jgi:Mannosyltransferase (PIG-V)
MQDSNVSGISPPAGSKKVRAATAEKAPVQASVGPEGSVSPVRRREALIFPCVVFVISRCVFLVLTYIAPKLIASPGIRANASFLPRTDPLAHWWQWTSPWFRFDARWYVGVAQHGYHWGNLGQANTNFLPLYPLLIRIFQPICLNSPWVASIVVSNLACLAAIIALWQWALDRWAVNDATRPVILTVAFPFAFFLAAPYAESLFLALAVAAFLFAERNRWELAVLAAGLSTVTRPVGMAVVLGLVVFALARGERKKALVACLAALPLLGFMVFLTIAFRQPLGFLTYHSAGWVPPHGGVPATLYREFHTSLMPFDRIDAFLAALFLASGVLAWRRLGPGYGVYVLVGVLLPLVHGLVSMERYVTVLFPAMATWALWRSRIGQAVVFGVSLMMMLVATILFLRGYSIF